MLRGFNDLLSANPMLAAEWDFTKNYPYTPEMFTVGSDKKFFWKCKNGHDSYLASIKKRSSGRGCPICGRKKAGKTKTATIIRTKGSVRDSFPLLAAEWDSERNKLGPESYPVESAEYVWWKCSLCGHHWSARIVSRTRMNSGCPNCNYRNKTSFPEQALLYYVKLLFPDVHNNSTAVLDNNLELDIYIPSQSIGIEYDGIIWHGEKRRVTDKRKYQICKKQGITLYRVRESNEDASDICDFYIVRSDSSSTESLDAAIRELLNLISKKPDVINVDSNRDRALIKAQYMVMLKNNSLQEKYPDIATEWHPMKNGEITPSMVYAHSQDIFWWICPHCGYEYEKRVSDRTRQNPSGCKKCSSKRKAEWKQCLNLIPGVNDLATLYPNLLEEWDYSKNTDVSPENVTVGSHKEVAWICCNCGYRWNTSVYNRTQGHGCPECGKKRAAETRRQKSIHSHGSLLEAYPEIAKQWDYEANKGITPDSISSNDSIQKCSWICSCGAKWESTVYSLTHSKYVGCRKCRYKQAGEYRKAHPEASPVFGHHLTKETKAKISAALSGEKNCNCSVHPQINIKFQNVNWAVMSNNKP